MSNRLRLRVNASITYAYVRPWRAMRGGLRSSKWTLRAAGIPRPWVRYMIIQALFVRAGKSPHLSRAKVTVVGWAWTRRQAEKMVDALRRAEP